MFEGEGVALDRLRERRRFTETRLRFDSMEALCAALGRDCSRAADGGTQRIRMAVPPGGVPGEGQAEITLRPAGRILSHNLDVTVRRGNRLVWTGPIGEIRANGLELEVETEARSVLAITLRTFLRAALIASALVVGGLAALVFVGRRRLRRA